MDTNKRLLNKIQKLEAREKKLIAENRALKAELDTANAVFEITRKQYCEYKQGVEDLNVLRGKYKEAIKAAKKEKKKIRSEFMAWIKTIRKFEEMEE